VLDVRLSELIEVTEEGTDELRKELESNRTNLKKLIEDKAGDLIRLLGKLRE
jgi:hypothetical protein